jgi:uncharacterized Zn finger protein
MTRDVYRKIQVNKNRFENIYKCKCVDSQKEFIRYEGEGKTYHDPVLPVYKCLECGELWKEYLVYA